MRVWKGKGRDVMFSHCPPVNYAQDIPTMRTKDWIFEHGGSHIKGPKNVCLQYLSILDLPNRENIHVNTNEWLLDSFRRGNIKDWDYVLKKVWKSPGACTLKTNGGQVLWLRGVYGSGCVMTTESRGVENHVREISHIEGKLSDMEKSLKKNPLTCLTKTSVYGDRVVKLFKTETIQGTAFLIDGTLDETTYFNCPEAIMEDVTRMWSIVGGNLPGIGLTTPTFSDGSTDYEPHLVGPAFSRGKMKKVILNHAD